VDHLHGHFVDPCIIKEGAYVMPANPGYSSELKEQTLEEFSFPWGSYWAGTEKGQAEQAWRTGNVAGRIAFASARLEATA
jgi:L-fuconate dehydratase